MKPGCWGQAAVSSWDVHATLTLPTPLDHPGDNQAPPGWGVSFDGHTGSLARHLGGQS